MRSSASPCLSAVLVLAALLAGGRDARAQACCAGASTLSPTRLTESESRAIGLQLKGSFVAGSFDGGGGWVPAPTGTNEVDLEEDLFGVVRLFDRLQLGLTVPLDETWRAVPGLADGGFGVGDVRLSGRWDALAPGESETWPGIALVAGASLPTGTPVESAKHLLAADATGLGSATGLLGLALEKPMGHVLLQLTGTLQQQLGRTANGVRETFGPEAGLIGALGWAFDSGPGIALVASFRHDGTSAIDGQPLPGSARTVFTLGLAGGMTLADGYRLQGSIAAPVPANGAGESTPASPAILVALLRSWP